VTDSVTRRGFPSPDRPAGVIPPSDGGQGGLRGDRPEDPQLDRVFFERPVLAVARDLLGRHLVRDQVVLRITEVEAYCGPTDTAAHSRSGKTARNEAMWGPAGRAYVYQCYGLHQMLNLVAGEPGDASAILIRSCEIVAGEAVVRERRGGKVGPVLLTGPGKVAQALAIDRSFNHHDLCEPGELEIRAGVACERALVGPRVGIDYADPAHRDADWRFACADTRWVSARRTLRAEPR
jgi:DNA-3-methyladenine glycosylase